VPGDKQPHRGCGPMRLSFDVQVHLEARFVTWAQPPWGSVDGCTPFPARRAAVSRAAGYLTKLKHQLTCPPPGCRWRLARQCLHSPSRPCYQTNIKHRLDIPSRPATV
jgi:hypothetical protein